MKKPYVITVSGCDDNTTVVVQLTNRESILVGHIADRVTANGGGCAPTMSIRPATLDDLPGGESA